MFTLFWKLLYFISLRFIVQFSCTRWRAKLRNPSNWQENSSELSDSPFSNNVQLDNGYLNIIDVEHRFIIQQTRRKTTIHNKIYLLTNIHLNKGYLNILSVNYANVLNSNSLLHYGTIKIKLSLSFFMNNYLISSYLFHPWPYLVRYSNCCYGHDFSWIFLSSRSIIFRKYEYYWRINGTVILERTGCAIFVWVLFISFFHFCTISRITFN